MGKGKSSLAQDFLKGVRSEPERKKFRCKHKPAHSNPKRNYSGIAPQDKYGRDEWVVEWAPCREADAIEYMREEHAYDYGRRHYIRNKKPHHKSQGEARSKKDNNPSDRGPSHQSTAAPAPDLHQGMRAQAAARQQHQQELVQPPAAVPDPGFGQPFGPPQPGSMGPAMRTFDMPHPGMHMRPNYEMYVDPAMNTAMGTHGPQGPQVSQGPPRDGYIVVTTEETSGPPNPRKHRTRPSRNSSRGYPPPASMRGMAAGMLEYRGMPSPPPSMSSPSMTASYHTRQSTPVSMPPFGGTEDMPPPPAPTPLQLLRLDEMPHKFRTLPRGTLSRARDTSP